MELIRTYPNVVLETDGRVFACASYSKQRADGRWEGRIVFFPLHGGPALATDRETTQPRFASLEYWADGLTPTFLQGALARAIRRGSGATPDLPPRPPAHGDTIATEDAARTDDPVPVRPPRGLTATRGDSRPQRGALLSITLGLNAGPLPDASRTRRLPDASRADRKVEAGEDGGDALALYASDLTERARRGEIDPLIGRDAEVDRVIRVLSRRRKNNPVLVGDPGAGKTAIVEGLALAIARRRVPAQMRRAKVYALDLGALMAGTRLRGEFEERLTGVISAIQHDPDAILFIDEIHTIVGAGAGADSTLDASNLLKPALAAGLRCIGSTTFPEYQASLEHDRALGRRFQKVDVREPTIEETVEILTGVSSRYEKHHRVRFTPEALRAAVELSVRYLRDRQLPDKAIDLIDEAGAAQRLSAGRSKRVVDVPEIEAVVAAIAGVPARTISIPDQERLRGLEAALKRVIFGQDAAVEALVRAIKLARAGVRPPDRPIGSFLFSGPTGVGKTELARQLARLLDVEFLRFDMSEYMETHMVARLIGAPPGYIGFEQGGLLTDAVRKSPYAVLLLDEIEKAHPDVFNILLQVMDYATLSDNHGRRADFRHVILILTTNAGARELFQPVVGFAQDQAASTQGRSEGAIARTFSPEFRNRLDASIAFEPLTPAVIAQVVDRQVRELAEQLAQKRISLSVSSQARAWLEDKGFDPKFGARPMARLIERQIAAPLADSILFGPLQSGGVVRVEVQDGSLHVAVTAA